MTPSLFSFERERASERFVRNGRNRYGWIVFFPFLSSSSSSLAGWVLGSSGTFCVHFPCFPDGSVCIHFSFHVFAIYTTFFLDRRREVFFFLLSLLSIANHHIMGFRFRGGYWLIFGGIWVALYLGGRCREVKVIFLRVGFFWGGRDSLRDGVFFLSFFTINTYLVRSGCVLGWVWVGGLYTLSLI